MASVRYIVRIKPREVINQRTKKKRLVPRPDNKCFYNGRIYEEGERVDFPDTIKPPEGYFMKLKTLEGPSGEPTKKELAAIEGIKTLRADYGFTDEFLAGIFGEAGATSAVDQYQYLQDFIKEKSLSKAK